MNSIWQTFLQEHNATIEKGHVIHFRGDDATELKNAQTDTILVDLSNFGLIHFSGEEALAFLQGQLTCDLRKVDHQIAQYGSYCSPKGRILANFIIWSHADHNEYFMQLPSTLLEAVSKRLSMYILRAKVRLNNSSDSLIRIGIAGNKARLLIKEVFHNTVLPISPLGIVHAAQGSILCRDINRYEIITTLDHAVLIWPHLALQALPVGTICWDWLEIKAGIPVILPITHEQFIPQMVNMDITGGVNFQKGCYPGQEIIARTQYLGKLKRRMYLVNIASSQPVMAGDQLFSAELPEQSCGMIVNATPSPDGDFDALAVIQINSVKSGKIFWKNLEGPALQILSLPYLLPQ